MQTLRPIPEDMQENQISLITEANSTVQTSRISPEDFSVKILHSLIDTEHVYSANIETFSGKSNVELRALYTA